MDNLRKAKIENRFAKILIESDLETINKIVKTLIEIDENKRFLYNIQNSKKNRR